MTITETNGKLQPSDRGNRGRCGRSGTNPAFSLRPTYLLASLLHKRRVCRYFL